VNSEITEKQLIAMRRNILVAAHQAGEGHIASAFSILETLFAVFDLHSQGNKNLNFELILSKGHASLALYSILEHFDFIDSTWQRTFASHDSNYGGHPDFVKVPSVAASTGSLGHGLPITIGKILANRILGLKQAVYCLVGDGELNEGTSWESLLIASHHRLSELVILVDNNHSSDRAVMLNNLYGKFTSFGFLVIESDGHCVDEIKKNLSNISVEKPTIIILNTIKGFGIKTMENDPSWHHRIPNELEMAKFMKELN
jgi:transketolase